MIDSKIGYIICETAATEHREAVVVGEKNNKVIAEVILQDMDVKNRNNRYYAESELKPELNSPRLQELIKTGNLKAESGHPMSKDIARQQTIDPNNVCAKILKIWTEGKDIKAHVRGTNNQLGEDFNNDILDGEFPSWSLRALGTIQNTSRGAEVKNIKIITWDRVIYPSHQRAYMTKIVSESANVAGTNVALKPNDPGLIIPITNQSVINYIKQESTNLKNVLESFELLYNSIDVVDNGRKVQLIDENGSILVINLESHIQNEIMNYCYDNF